MSLDISINSSSLHSADQLQKVQPKSPIGHRMDEGIMELDVLERIYDGSIKPTYLKLSALQSITENFSHKRIIGTGGFGTVYKGVLRNKEVAVKRIKSSHTIDEKLFHQEVDSLWKVSHKNIVRFIGFCSNTEHEPIEDEESGKNIYAEIRERILCFEYINNGSLDKYIADELRGLPWDTRVLIIKGICEGLQYLHMDKHIIHMDLKPANILIDNNMVAKITDFGLSRMDKNTQTKSTTRMATLGYSAPEYIDSGKISVKYDVYSLGIIIIELVTGSRKIPDTNNGAFIRLKSLHRVDTKEVLRRWSHRWHKSGKETPFRYQQIAKLIEIGLLCQDNDPYKRPFISDILRLINELESNANEPTVGHISPYSEDDMLGIEPLELLFPFKLNTQVSCSLELTNKTNDFIAFSIQTTSPLEYSIQPEKYIVAPHSRYPVNIILQPIDKAPEHWQYTGDFMVQSTKMNESLVEKVITEDTFSRWEGKLVDEVNLTITYKAEVPEVDVPLATLIISDTENLNGPQESSVAPTEVESKVISASTSDEVIQFDPPQLCFPLVPDKKVLSSVKITNITECYVSLALSYSKENSAKYSQYSRRFRSIMPPGSTQWLTLIREEKENAVKDMQSNDQVFVLYAIAAEDMKASDIHKDDYNDCKMLPVVLSKIISCTSKELIQIHPPKIHFPCLNMVSVSAVNIENITDCYVYFNIVDLSKNIALYKKRPSGILPPRGTQRVVVKRVPKENEPEVVQCEDKLFVWSMIVAEGVEHTNIRLVESVGDAGVQGNINLEGSKELPIICKKISPCTSRDKIRFDNPGLPLPSWHKSGLYTANIVNVTDYYVGFRICNGITTVVPYPAYPELGILAPQSAQRVIIATLAQEKESNYMQHNGKFAVLSNIVSKGIKASDVKNFLSMPKELSNKLPTVSNKIASSTWGSITSSLRHMCNRVITKITSSISVELIKFEPPEVRFRFLPSKRLLSSIKIVNITNCRIGFNTHVEETNMALYITEPPCGILPPRSTQRLVITRVAKEDGQELEDMQCTDKYFVWSCFVTEDVKASDLKEWMPTTERKELPVVFTETTSNKLIQFDPPELCIPFLPNQRVLSSAKIVNITDQYIGFRICTKKSSSATYYANPPEGILPPQTMQVLLLTRIADEKEIEDTQCADKFFVWNGIVSKDVKVSDVIDNMSQTRSTKLTIVLAKTRSSISDKLIQFDVPELHFPFLPNKKVLSSINIVNLTDHNVGFNTYSRPTNAAWYHTDPQRGILPPRFTQKLMVTREEKEDAFSDDRFNDKYFVWKSIVSEGVKGSDLSDYMSDQESKELPIVLHKKSSLTTDELIQLDPAELCMPHLPNKQILFIVNVANTTDFYVAFNVYTITKNAVRYKESTAKGILQPRCTGRCILTWVIGETEPIVDYFVWNRVVTEGVESGDIIGYMGEEESKKLPFILDKASPCTSKELIQFDPPEISLPFMPNKPLVFTVNIVNSTDYYVGFNTYEPQTNMGLYYIQPEGGVMPPQTTQRLVVKRVPDEEKQDDMQCEDQFFLWSSLVSEGVKVSDIDDDYINYDGSKELPIVHNTTSLCTSDELIQLDPPQLPFPFLPNKSVSMLSLLKIVNITDHSVGFHIWCPEENSACYVMEPEYGILAPKSTQKLKVKRILDEKEREDMQCNDKILVWNGIVTEGVEVSDVGNYWDDEDKELPIVLTKPGERSSR